MGDTDTGVRENIMLSEGEIITFTVKRFGVDEPITVKSGYNIPESAWYDRRAMRQVGIMMGSSTYVGKVLENSPAALAGIMERDEILSVNGKRAPYTFQHIVDAEESGQPATLIIKRDGVENTFT